MHQKELHIISTGQQTMQEFVDIIVTIHHYVDYIHIREKMKTAKEIYETVRLLTEKNIPLSKIVINDRVDIAYATKVSGVQLAYHSLDVRTVKAMFPGLRVGVSVHSKEEAVFGELDGADYCLYGHIFRTQSKQGIAPRGINVLKQIVHSTNLPVIAIGGIKPEHVEQVIDVGARGIAVLSGVLLASNPLKAIKYYSHKLGREGDCI